MKNGQNQHISNTFQNGPNTLSYTELEKRGAENKRSKRADRNET